MLIQRMMLGGSTDYTDTDTMIVDWGDGTSTMVIGSGLNPLFVHTYNVPFTDNYTLISEG